MFSQKIKGLFTLQNYYAKLFGLLSTVMFMIIIMLLIRLNTIQQLQCKYLQDKKIVAEQMKVLSRSKKKFFIWPVRGKLTSNFGERWHPLFHRREFHCGLDIAVPSGTIVRAAANGRVIVNGWLGGYGWVIVIWHTDGYMTVYAHNRYNYKRAGVGKWVKQGSAIALSGNTGHTTGPHLHFEIRRAVNPLCFLGDFK